MIKMTSEKKLVEIPSSITHGNVLKKLLGNGSLFFDKKCSLDDINLIK